MAIAVPRNDYTEGQDLSDWMTEELRRNPNYQLPKGYEVDAQGRVRRSTGNFLLNNPWLFPVAGVTAGLGLPALLGLGGGASAGSAGAAATGLSEAGIPTTLGMGTAAAEAARAAAAERRRQLADIRAALREARA